MTPEELYEEWMADDEDEGNGLRPKRVQVIRDDLARITGLPIPRRLPEIENWLDTMQGDVTKKVKEAYEESQEEQEEEQQDG